MSILKTNLIIPSIIEETNSSENEIKRLVICMNDCGDGLSPAQVLYLKNSLRKWLAFIEKEKTKDEEDYRLEKNFLKIMLEQVKTR